MSASITEQPLQIAPKLLRSRIYVPAHQPGLAVAARPGSRYIEYQRARARSGVGMQITGATPIVGSREWSDICLWNIDDSIIPGYQRLSDAVHEEGGLMLAQLAHPGPTEFDGPDNIGPSPDFSEVSRQVVVEAHKKQLGAIVDLYGAAAVRCRQGGLDGVEVSLAHGLLLAAFLSPLMNRRQDSFGGSLNGRMSLILSVLQRVREALSDDMILGVRLGVDDLVDGGLVPSEAALIALALENYVDYISVIVGNNNRLESRVQHWPPTPAEHGLFRSASRIIKDAVSVPVCAVGRITTIRLADEIIESGDADLVGMVRAHIADPDILTKSLRGQEAEVRPCVGANTCVNGLLADRPLACLVNPDVGHEGETTPTTGGNGHRVVVIGAGPAGLEVSRRLALAGLEVILYEADWAIGGQMRAWSLAPSRREVGNFLEWEVREVTRLGVDIRIGVKCTARSLADDAPEVVLVATGASAAPVKIVSDGTIQVVDPLEALRTGALGRVVVFDGIGELDAALIAERCCELGATDVSLVTSRIHVGEGEGISTLFPMLRRLNELGVRVLERQRLGAIREGEIHFSALFGGPTTWLPADVLVPWCGGSPVTDLIGTVRSQYEHSFVLGDALRPRRVLDAMQEARLVANSVIHLVEPKI